MENDQVKNPKQWNLHFEINHVCSKSRARVATVKIGEKSYQTPVFMPVGTNGTIKGVLPCELEEIGVPIILANTYHLGTCPGDEIVKASGGIHKFMNWKGLILTDSGGFQMVSLAKLSKVNEDGVNFEHPINGTEILLSPEKSMQIQNNLGSDIVMQLDDVISSTISGEIVERAMNRSIRWLQRCYDVFPQPTQQNLFPIIQGGLDVNLRRVCVSEMVKLGASGYAIGGLSGGESKDDFWRIVACCTELLPSDKPRYLMGVGYAIDLVVCSALGCDMFDCVFPTRTARFGSALTFSGSLNLKSKTCKNQFTPIEEGCSCYCCQNYTRAYLHHSISCQPLACSLISIHNIHFQIELMRRVRAAIAEDKFEIFVNDFIRKNFPSFDAVPSWVVDSLAFVNITVQHF